MHWDVFFSTVVAVIVAVPVMAVLTFIALVMCLEMADKLDRRRRRKDH